MAAKKSRKQSVRKPRLSRRQLKTLRDSIAELRHHFKGFDAKSGYSLRADKLKRITATKLKKVKHRIRELHREQSAPYKLVRPRSAAARRALYAHTGAEKVRGRKTFLVHVAKPERTTIELVGKKKQKRVREVRRVKGARVEQQYFYFRDYAAKQPKTMVQIRRVAAKMLKDMPPGYYVMLSKDFGHISVSMHRDELLNELERDWLKYDAKPDPFARVGDSRGLAGTLVGFSLVSLTEDGANREWAQRLSRRQRMRVAADSGKSVFRRKRRR